MSSYSYLGAAKVWIPRDEEDSQIGCAEPCTLERTASNSSLRWQPYSESPNEKWSVKRLMRLLRLYGAHRCLWDTSDLDNRNRKLRHAALVDITAAMGEGVKRTQVIQKFNVLRATYRYEKRRIKQRIRRGSAASTKLKWFALADAFLRYVPRPEKQRRRDNADTDSDLEDAVVFSIDPESLIPLDEDNDFASTKQVTQNVEVVVGGFDSSAVEAGKITEAHSIESGNVLFNKRKWTPHDSLQFIYLLRAYPELWRLKPAETDNALEQRAIAQISQTMLLPIHRIQKRLHSFVKTYRSEMLKIRQDANYKPNLVWWPMAQEFSLTLNSPVTEQQTHLNCKQSSNFDELQQFETPLDTKVQLQSFQSSSPLQNVKDYLCDTTLLRKPPLKLIWNGLEDDLLEGKWSLKHSVKFLRMYGAHRCLWDLNDSDYRSRELRNAAINDIASAMGYGLDADYVAKKIKIFRITYMQHRKRMLEALKASREPEVQLRWFPLADSFLRPHIGLRSIKQDERELPQFDFQYVYANLNLIDPALLADINTNMCHITGHQ